MDLSPYEFEPSPLDGSAASIAVANVDPSSGCKVNVAEFGVGLGVGDDSYVPVPVADTSPIAWFLDSGATHHVCNDASILRGTAPYSGNDPLLMGDDTRTNIASVVMLC